VLVGWCVCRRGLSSTDVARVPAAVPSPEMMTADRRRSPPHLVPAGPPIDARRSTFSRRRSRQLQDSVDAERVRRRTDGTAALGNIYRSLSLHTIACVHSGRCPPDLQAQSLPQGCRVEPRNLLGTICCPVHHL